MRLLALVCALLGALALAPAARAQSAQTPWRDTGVALAEDALVCLPPGRPSTAVVADAGGTRSYDWRAGAGAPLSARRAAFCAPDGALYAPDGDGAWRFSLADPAGARVARMPTHSTDDPALLYAAAPGDLWASEDGGRTWVQRSVPITPSQFVVARGGGGRHLYALHTISEPAPGDDSRSQLRYLLFFSADGGVAWTQRAIGVTGFCHYVGVQIWRVEGAPSDLIGMDRTCADHPGSGFVSEVLLSRDGAETFETIGGATGHAAFQLVSTSAGLLRYSTSRPFARSTDEGRTWQELGPPPPIEDVSVGGLPFVAAPGDPSTVVLRDAAGALWVSHDSGASWGRVEGESALYFRVSAAAPPVVAGRRGGTLRVLELVPPGGARCFPETGGCISGRIRQYWEQNGGLPVFGFPIGPQQPTLVEGRAIPAQWFERNRLELHPENAAPYDVLLGRLGADALGARGVDWQALPKAEQAAPHYFTATGQAIAPEFWAYWSSHGLELDGRRGASGAESLALFGLPLTPAQVEVSQTDGRPYLTQYFERARFEYHPENAGTPYVVLLGLLGSERGAR